MFKEVDASHEAEIMASQRKRGPDFSIRTVTHWHTLPVHFGFCSVPTHYDNVPETDKTGEPYDKHPSRLCATIGQYEVCRWCFVASADVAAQDAGLKPVPAGKDEHASD